MDYSHQQHHKKLLHNFDVVIPFLRFEKELEKELLLNGATIHFKNSKIFAVSNLPAKPIWAQDWWPQAHHIQFSTKSEALKILKAQPNLGVFYNSAEVALAAGLRKEIREFKVKRIKYEVPSAFNFKYFAWTMFDNSSLIVCDHPTSQFPLGWNEFNEDKVQPPNRAYLKLWELLTLNYIQLKKTDVGIDVGSSPGGWSWVLSDHIKKVYSVDKAPLDKKVSSIPNIIYRSGDAFQIDPKDFLDCNLFFSDIICTPERLYELVQNWMAHSEVKTFVCTIKFKGPTNFDMLDKFRKIKNSTIIHLYQNKNEVTWIRRGSS